MITNDLSRIYVSNHLSLCQELFNTLKLYIECKNCGIHGIYIGIANKSLNNLYLEIANLKAILSYISGDSIILPIVYKKEIPILLKFKPSTEDEVKHIRDELELIFSNYKMVKQSACVNQIQKLLEVI